MRASFTPLDESLVETVVPLMASLYGHPPLNFWDEGRARRGIATLLAHPEHGAIWLIAAEGGIAGYFVLTLCFSIEFHGRFVLLDEFFIDERWRGQGLGAQALDFIAQHCRTLGVTVIRLEVDRANPRAETLYQRHGFVAEERNLMTRFLLKL